MQQRFNRVQRALQVLKMSRQELGALVLDLEEKLDKIKTVANHLEDPYEEDEGMLLQRILEIIEKKG